MNLSRHAAYFMATRLHSLRMQSVLTAESEVHKNVRISFSRKKQGLQMFGKVNSQMPNTGPFTVKVLGRNQVGCHVSPHQKVPGKGAQNQGFRVPGLCSDAPLSTRWAEACAQNILDLQSYLERQREYQTIPS